MYSTTIVAGRVGRDAELRATPSGDSVLAFSVAVDRGWGDNKRTVWFAVSVWGDRAAKLASYITKGTALLIEGDIDSRAYTAKDGTPRAALELRARDVRFLGGKRDEDDNGNTGPSPLYQQIARQDRQAPPEPVTRTVKLNDLVTDEPLPF